MEEYSYTSTHPLGHTGPVTGSLYLTLHLEELSEIWSKIYFGLHIKYPLFLPDLNETWNWSTDFWKKKEESNFMKISPFGEDLFLAGGQTFRNFVKVPNKWDKQKGRKEIKLRKEKKNYHHWIKRLRRKGRRWPDDVLRPADCSDVVRRRDGPVRRISDRVTAARKQIRDVTYVSKASCGEAQRYSQNVASLGGLRNLPLGVITDPPTRTMKSYISPYNFQHYSLNLSWTGGKRLLCSAVVIFFSLLVLEDWMWGHGLDPAGSG